MTQYRVIAPLVNVKTMTQQGLRYVYVYQGGVVPDDASAEWIGYHLRDHMIEEVPEPAPAVPEPKAEKPAAKPAVSRGRTAGGG